MKKKILGLIIGLFLIVGLTQSGYAATYSSWILDIDPSSAPGADDQVAITEFIDINSPNLVLAMVDPGSNPPTYSFSNDGITYATDVDSSGTFDDRLNLFSLTANYSFTGTGVAGDEITFDSGGILNLNVGAVKVAQLSVIDGSGSVDVEALPNGQLSISYYLEVIESGYLLWEDGTPITSAFATTTTNASEITNISDVLKKDLLDAAGIINEDDLDTYDIVYYLSSNGQFRLSEVPVPSAFLLLGSGIIGLVGFRRKNS